MDLVKYQANGNDFLIVFDLDPASPVEVDPARVRGLCDRYRGIGADGFIRATRGSDGATLKMDLVNSDGSPAETSGNGLRCLALAAAECGVVDDPEIVIIDGGGTHRLTLGEGGQITVDMGSPKIDDLTCAPGAWSAFVDTGNHHLVMTEDGEGLDLKTVASSYPDRNVELVRLGGDDAKLVVRVWERGAGETLSCGSGAVAAAAAARRWGLAGDRVRVSQPGGTLDVDLSGETALLTGPAQRAFKATVDLS
jgi:diaminopimelate epimerase